MRKPVFIMLMLILASTTAAVEMKRADELAPRESREYKFLKNNYTIRVTDIQGSGGGLAEIRVNDFKREVRAGSPVFFGNLKISINEVKPYSVVLDMLWHKEDEEPDEKLYAAQNAKKEFEHNGKKYSVVFKDYDRTHTLATIQVNSEEFTLKQWEKRTLSDDSIVKFQDITGSDIKTLNLYFWISDTEVEQEEEVRWDAETRITEQQQARMMAKGAAVPVKVVEVTDDKEVSLVVQGEEAALREGEEKILLSGIKIKVSQVSTGLPPSALVSITVPEEMASEERKVSTEITLSLSQKAEFELDRYKINVRFLEADVQNNSVKISVNNQEFEVKEGDVVEENNIRVTTKVINLNMKPHKVIMEISVPKEPVTVGRPEEQKEEQKDPMGKQANKTNKTEINDTEAEMNETPLPAEQEPEKVESEVEETEPESNEPTLSDTIQKVMNSIGNFFRWLLPKTF